MPSTWEDIGQGIRIELDDDLGVLHTKELVRRYMEHAELLIACTRLNYEKTVDFALTANVAEYIVTNIIPDAFVPLRFAIAGVALSEVKLSTLVNLRPKWRTERGTPKQYCRVGSGLFVFIPVPDINYTAQLTHAATPPTENSTPAAAETIAIADVWAEPIMSYGIMMGNAVDGQIDRAQLLARDVAAKIGIERDLRFMLSGQQRKGRTSPEAPTQKENERP